MQPSLKGNQIILAKKYLAERFGQAALTEAINQMNEKNREVITGFLNSAAWAPEEAWTQFLVVTDKVLGRENYQLCREIGYNLAKMSIPRFYKVFIKLGDPSFVIKRAAMFWRQVHNTGRLETDSPSPNTVRGRLFDKAFPHRAFCASLAGYFKGTLELCGAKNILVRESACVCAGSKACEFLVSWQ